ncbi:hypothetical protein FRC09_007146 [Ceratobasidium sp. 395]|nr:hypothetical protein FRC09_007146 [Ceratobasidium sp. 395]
MPCVLEQLAAAINRREQQAAAEHAASPGWGSSENGDAAPPPLVPDSLIDPALPRSEPTSTRRRGYAELDDSDVRKNGGRFFLTDTPAERKLKFARFTEDSCNAYALRSKKRLEVQDFSGLNLHAKLIALFAHSQSVSRDLGMRDAKSFASTVEGKEQTQNMLKALILAPTNKCYVTGTSIKDFLKGDVLLHWDVWRVGHSTTQDPDALKELLKQFLASLTSMRNDIKETLNKAYKESWCINRVMNELTPDSMYITNRHRARWAWILTYYREHHEGSQKDNKFWHNLDKTLGEMEEALADQEPDLTDRAALRELVFEHALETYRNQFPTKVPAREAPYDAPSWQVTLEARLARGLGFSASN